MIGRGRAWELLETAWVVVALAFVVTLPAWCGILAGALIGEAAGWLAFFVAGYIVYDLPQRVGADELSRLSAPERWGHNIGRAVRSPLAFFTSRRSRGVVGGALPVGVRALPDGSASPSRILQDQGSEELRVPKADP